MSTPITCHVLNTLSGTPAADLPATLTLLSAVGPLEATTPSITYHALTNSDGRVKEWSPSSSSSSSSSSLGGSNNNNNNKSLSELVSSFPPGSKVPFSIKFEIGQWYEKQGIESFWPEVEVKFYVKVGERHYHVPVLVGPWTYTTYRGS